VVVASKSHGEGILLGQPEKNAALPVYSG
jgi:hypothetical protein